MTIISLEEITSGNIHAVLALSVSEEQESSFPRSNAYSIAEGVFSPDEDPVWMRAICKDGEPIGFLMTSEAPQDGNYFLWRMMIDERHQGNGYGEEAMRLLIDRIKNNGNARELSLSHLWSNTKAGKFYSKIGFSYTGNDLGEGDREMSLRFPEDA